MTLNNLYEEMWFSALEKFKENQFSLDQQMDDKDDLRRGITLLLRPCDKVKKKISDFLQEVRSIEPYQYYYPLSDIHITVMSIIPCCAGFKLEDINVPNYLKVVQESFETLKKDYIRFKGITASPSCIMIKGFPENNQLNQLRDNLRKNFSRSNLQSALDKRYEIQAAHATVIRFKAGLNNKTKFLQISEKYRKHDFGTFEADNFELVFNDWYQKKINTRVLQQFS